MQNTRTVIALAALLLAAAPALAQIPPLTDENYRIDFYEGPVLGSTRVIGLGGAFAAIAENSVGIPFNPASVSHRTAYTLTGFDWDISFDWLTPGIFQNDHLDFDNNSRHLDTYILAGSAGGRMQFRSLGFGAYGRWQRYKFRDRSDPQRRFEASLGIVQLTGGYGMFAHQLILGGGFRFGLIGIKERGAAGNSFSATTGGLDLGALIRPDGAPWRLGASIGVPLSSKIDPEDTTVPGPVFYLPGEGIGIPLEFRLGGAYSFGRRMFNPPPGFVKARLAARGAPPAPGTKAVPASKYLDDFFLTLSAEIVVCGPVENAIGTDGFLEQVMERSGQRTTVSPRFGLETELWPGRLRLRGGSYWEPSRFEGYSGRLHMTMGFELRVLDFEIFGAEGITIQGAVDVATRYSNVSLSIGFWH